MHIRWLSAYMCDSIPFTKWDLYQLYYYKNKATFSGIAMYIYMISFCNLIGSYRLTKAPEVDRFFADITRLSPLPVFEERASEVYGRVARIESVQESLERLPWTWPYTEDVVDILSRGSVEGAHFQGTVSPASPWRCWHRKGPSWCPSLFPVFVGRCVCGKKRYCILRTMSKSVCIISQGNGRRSLSSKERRHSEVPLSCGMLR